MKYRMKAALLAICVSACSAFGFSVYAEGSMRQLPFLTRRQGLA